MANQPRKTNWHHSIRFETDEWEVSEVVTAEMDTNRTKALNEFLRWYLRRPGAELPERPPAALVEQAFEEWRSRQPSEGDDRG